MGYRRMHHDSTIWIEDQSYIDSVAELGRKAGELKAKDEEIARLIKERDAALAKKEQP